MSRPCKPVLEELPPEIAKQIVGELDLVSRICVRKTCRNFRNTVNDRKVHISSFYLTHSDDSTFIRWSEKDRVDYKKHPQGCLVTHTNNGLKKNEVIQEEDYITCAMRDLATILVIPKLSIKYLSVTHDNRSDTKQFVEPLKAILRSRDSKLSVKDLDFLMNLDQDDIFDFLSQVKPGTLENVSITQSENNFNLGRIAELPQWKQAKSLHMRIGNEPIDSFLHFNFLSLQYRNELSMEDAKKLVEAAIQQGVEFNNFLITECECDYHIGGYLEQIGTVDHPGFEDDDPLPSPIFGPYHNTANDPVNRMIRKSWELEVFLPGSWVESRFVATQNEQFCLLVKWEKTSFAITKY